MMLCMYLTAQLRKWFQALQGEPAPEDGSKEETEVTELCLHANSSRAQLIQQLARIPDT